jgi:DNA-directed RNA polymerase subunit H
MATTSSQNASNLISFLYNSRNTVLELMERQGYDVRDYAKFSVNDVCLMKQNNQLDMLLEKKQNDKVNKIYIRYFLNKIRPNDLDNMIEDLFLVEEVLNKSDTLFIITKDDINETMTTKLVHIWETEGIFVVIVSIKRLQFNILKHSLVPEHRVLQDSEIESVMKQYNIVNKTEFPDISRFDPVAQVIGLRPGQLCCIRRPSKTAIQATYYRLCI